LAQVATVINPGAFAWSPDGNRLLYADYNGLWELPAPNFYHPVQLIRWHTIPGHYVTQISWSPDAKRVAFVSVRLGDEWDTVWVANADGSKLHDGVPVSSPINSPGIRSMGIETWLDNQRIALAMGCGTGYVCHYIADTESGEASDLCSSTGPLFWSANKEYAVAENKANTGCSPQGLGLAFARNATPVLPDPQVGKECWSYFGGCLDRCCEPPRSEPVFSAWQPPAVRYNWVEYVLYADRTEHGIDLKLWNVRDGTRSTLVEDAHDGQWSPNGKEIEFMLEGDPIYNPKKQLLGGTGTKGQTRLVVMEFPSRRVLAVTNPLTSVTWSPDSSSLTGIGTDGALYVWSPAFPTIRPRKLKPGVAGFSWSPNGDWIAVTTGGRNQAEIPVNADETDFIPPVGSDEFNLSEAVATKRYFEGILPQTDSKSEWKFRLAYARALEKLDEPKAAAAQYQKLFAILDQQPRLKGNSTELLINESYDSFAAHYPKYALTGMRYAHGYTPGADLTVGGNTFPDTIPGQLLTIIDMRRGR
jgi:WD40 repeat protein